MSLELLSDLAGFFRRDSWLVMVDLLDIGLVAFLVYRLLLLIKGTRAMQMAVGLAFVFAAYQFARQLRLVTLWSILDAFLTYVVIIIVVIFQNDIRRGLMRVGRQRLFAGGRAARDERMLEEVVKAAAALAQKRIGAIVVFERDATLDEFVEQGTELDANVTKELIYSIFVPSYENPMHDGAVVIREGRIWKAGAFLPLATSPRLDKAVGTRHRAALGISEETDAVSVVVSEERGAISLCFNGNIVRNLDANSLREALHGLFQKRRKKRRDGGRASLPPPEPTTREPTGRHALGPEPAPRSAVREPAAREPTKLAPATPDREATDGDPAIRALRDTTTHDMTTAEGKARATRHEERSARSMRPATDGEPIARESAGRESSGREPSGREFRDSKPPGATRARDDNAEESS